MVIVKEVDTHKDTGRVGIHEQEHLNKATHTYLTMQSSHPGSVRSSETAIWGV